ncbi:MAG: DUF2934 domain-containing protein [Bdellovibrio bacteriovorus]
MTLFDSGSASPFVPMRSRLAAKEAAWLAGLGAGKSPLSHEPAQRERLVREWAYFRAQRRGFVPGHEVEDWLAAERELERTSQSRLLV